MKKAFAITGFCLAVSSAAFGGTPTQDEGPYTDAYMTRTGQFSTAQDAWDEGFRQGLAANGAPTRTRPAAAPIGAPGATPDTATTAPDNAEGSANAGASGAPCTSPPVCNNSMTYSYGTGVPLQEALQEIAPKGWTVTVPASAANVKVTWNAGLGRPWMDVAQAVAHEAGLYVGINPANEAISVADSQENADKLCSGEQSWDIVAGKTLKQNLKDWASKAGWGNGFDWEAKRVDGSDVDYPVTHGATFIGTFNGRDSVVQQVLALYDHAEFPLAFAFTENHVLLITIQQRNAPTAAPGLE